MLGRKGRETKFAPVQLVYAGYKLAEKVEEEARKELKNLEE